MVCYTLLPHSRGRGGRAGRRFRPESYEEALRRNAPNRVRARCLRSAESSGAFCDREVGHSLSGVKKCLIDTI